MTEITHDEAQAKYRAAVAALDDILFDAGASQADKDRADEELETLTVDFVGKQMEEVEARTAQYEAFIGRLEALIDSIGGDSRLAGVASLKEVVGQAKDVLARVREGGRDQG